MEYLINSVDTATTKGGRKYLRMQLYEAGGRAWKAVCWEYQEVKSGQVIDALTEESEYNGESQLNVKAMRVINKDPGDIFLPRSKYSVEAMYEELREFTLSVENENLKKLLILAFADPRWKRAPAAKAHHHAFLGGLLEHTVNLCRLAHNVSTLYPSLRRDLLVTAAVLHDLGKMDEMKCGVTIEYTPVGNLLGHIAIGILRVDKWCDQLGFSPELKLTVLHLIGSHHGNPAYGAIKQPALVEAQVFSCLDGIDASIGKMTALVEKTPADREYTDKIDYNSPALYMGPSGLEPVSG